MNSGIYKITNLENNKFYIGSSIDVNKRMNNHLYLLKSNKHYNNHLQNSYNKYGENNFNFEKIKDCEISVLLQIEKDYIDNLKPEYNIDTIGDTFKRVCSNETKKIMSEKAKNRTWSSDIKNKMSESRKNSLKAIEAGKRNKEKRSIKIEVLDINGNINIYDSMKEAAFDLKIPHSSIIKYTKKDKFYKDLYKFSRII